MLLRSLAHGLLCAAMLPLTASVALAAPAPARACSSSQLRAAVASDSGAMLHRDITITLTNSGRSACVIDGYPAIRLLDAQHHASVAAESFLGGAAARVQPRARQTRHVLDPRCNDQRRGSGLPDDADPGDRPARRRLAAAPAARGACGSDDRDSGNRTRRLTSAGSIGQKTVKRAVSQAWRPGPMVQKSP